MDNTFPDQTFAERIISYGETQADKTACIFLTHGPETAVSINYKELRQRVLERASVFLEKGLVGKNMALVFPTGIDFVVEFIACLYAGVIAIPLNLSRNEQQFSRTLTVLRSAQPTAISSTSETIDYIRSTLTGLDYEVTKLLWLDENSKPDAICSEFRPGLNDLAFIQYTSGSTSEPKGVMVTQANIVANQESICRACDHKPGLIAGGWLPQFHDMGLIGHMMQPLYLGGTYVFMPPMNFIQRPRRWLEMISYYRIHSSASPNFGYDHCVNFISSREDLSSLDLSCWRVALNGSEPVDATTMTRFAERFAEYGFHSEAFFPCYGMAETTLFVSGGPVGSGMQFDCVDAGKLERGDILKTEHGIKVVNCGKVAPEFKVKIVNPDTHLTCSDQQVGEVWLQGPSVAKGYWGNTEVTSEIFQAKIIGHENGVWMRTGDLGYLRNGCLYITGRRKELLIVRGRNIYPYDIERTCNGYLHAAGTSAVTTVNFNGGSLIGAVVEIKKSALLSVKEAQLRMELRGLVMDAHEIALDLISLVRPGTIPRTTSGKLKRADCKNILIENLDSPTTRVH